MFVPNKPFQLIIMFVGKAGSLPLSGVGERCFTCKCCSFIHKQLTRLERPSKDKHSSLLRIFINYKRKRFHNIGPRKEVTGCNK